MTLKKLNNGSIENILRKLSIILVCLAVLLFVYIFLFSSVPETVEWNDMIVQIPNGSEYDMTDTSLTVKGKYSSQDFELKITNSTDNFNKYMGNSMIRTENQFNATHNFYIDDSHNIGFIVPKDSVKSDSEGLSIIGSPRIIEATAKDSSMLTYLMVK